MGQDRSAGSRVDSIVHFTSAQQVPRGGLLSSSPPDWLSRGSAAARVWLQHWLKPKHLKGEAWQVDGVLLCLCRAALFADQHCLSTLGIQKKPDVNL